MPIFNSIHTIDWNHTYRHTVTHTHTHTQILSQEIYMSVFTNFFKGMSYCLSLCHSCNFRVLCCEFSCGFHSEINVTEVCVCVIICTLVESTVQCVLTGTYPFHDLHSPGINFLHLCQNLLLGVNFCPLRHRGRGIYLFSPLVELQTTRLWALPHFLSFYHSALWFTNSSLCLPMQEVTVLKSSEKILFG